MKVIRTTIPDVLIIKPQVFGDARGFFMETFHAERYRDAGIPGPFVQDNFSRSVRNVLRGLHYQIRNPQGKLVQVLKGKVYDIAVDIRSGSPHFGRWVGVELSDENNTQFYVPPGFAHGFCVLSDTVDFAYKCTDYYDPEDEAGVCWNDPDIGIDWPLDNPVLSSKDKIYPALKDVSSAKLPDFP
ncbi:MAG: dTDP-4-dehydrorhamnose 3,5-epimerase [Mariprofundaceae bacterium]